MNFKGTTAACVRHFVSSKATVGAAVAAFREKYPNSFDTTVSRWFKKDTLPTGTNLIQLQCFLESAGYTLSDVPTMIHPSVRTLRRAVADGRTTLSAINSAVGYTQDHQALVVLHGKVRPLEEKMQIFDRLAANLPEMKLQADVLPVVKSATVVKQSLVAQISALAPLVELVLSDAFTADDRDEIRKMSGGDGIFNLKNSLARLCGERARNNL